MKSYTFIHDEELNSTTTSASLLLTELHLSPSQEIEFIELDLPVYNLRQVIRDSGSYRY